MTDGLAEGDRVILHPDEETLARYQHEAEQNLVRDWINGGAAWPEGLVIGPKEEPGI